MVAVFVEALMPLVVPETPLEAPASGVEPDALPA